MVVSVEHLMKQYKETTALKDFNLQVERGEIIGLLGPNGCGKTTAINCMLSLLTFDKGNIKIFGETMKPDSYHLKRRIGVVPQEVSVFENLTVAENIDYFCGLYIDNSLKRKDLVEKAISFVELSDFKKFFPKKLSGGLKRRLNIACGIAHQPELIFLDEPTVAVDAQSRNFILQGIKKLKENGSSIIYTTHYLEEVEYLCDRIVIMDNGKNIAQGTKDELIDKIETAERISIEFSKIDEEKELSLKKLENAISVVKTGDEYSIEFRKGNDNLQTLMTWIQKEKLSYIRLYSQKPSLNDVFLSLTGKELRD